MSRCAVAVLTFLLLLPGCPLTEAGTKPRHLNSPPLTDSPSSPPPPSSSLLLRNFSCANLVQMLQRKSKLLLTLGHRIDDIKQEPVATTEEKLKVEILKIYQNELKATEKSLLMILRDLNQTLGSDYRSLAQVKHSCQLRLYDMRNAAVKVEEDFNTILDLEKEMHALHPNSNLTHGRIFAEIMSEVSHAADLLESQLSAADIFQDSRHQEGAALETVVKLQEAAVAEHLNLAFVNGRRLPVKDGGGGGGGVMSVLVDSASNQYVLSRPRDATVPIEDHQFIHDVVNLLLLSFALGTLCSLIKVPSLLGYIMAGLLLGPFGYNTVTSVVQESRDRSTQVSRWAFIRGQPLRMLSEPGRVSLASPPAYCRLNASS
jgi:hypothetical protein